jgi:FtsP/CotA-like multicopper oxidase with cupredoxin domain
MSAHLANNARQPKARRWAYGLLAGAIAVQVAVAIGLVIAKLVTSGGEVSAQVVREYNLEIVATDIDYGGGNIWHAWTFAEAGQPVGTVPGPTLTVTAGEKLVVNVKNNLDLVHSFHSHLSNYDQEDDGAQTNIISGVGTGAMIPPGGEWSYTFEPTEPGVYYYHCHSADGGLMITQHMHQGLYGVIIVRAPDEPPVREEVLVMGEMGHITEGASVPPYIMNGLGLPGGEHALEAAYHEGGLDAVVATLGTVVPAYRLKVGEELRLRLVNIGDLMHTFHAHNVNIFSEQALGGRQWPANVVPLLPGIADTVTMTFTKPGLWLFHCHVVNHADAGMIGLFVVEGDGVQFPESQGSGQPVSRPGQPGSGQPPPTSTPGGGGTPSATLDLEMSEWKIAGAGGGAIPSAAAGSVEVSARNRGAAPHQLVVIKTDTDPADLPIAGTQVDEAAAGDVIGKIDIINPGALGSGTFTLDAGAYALICNVPTHYQLGMHASLTVQ